MSIDIVLIGSGNMATNLGLAFKEASFNIKQVYSREINHANKLARLIECPAVDDTDQIYNKADLYIIAVSDDAVAEIAGKIKVDPAIVVHTSGSVNMEALERSSSQIGVFYPLQTVSKDYPVSFKNIPICIEASDNYVKECLDSLAAKISDLLYTINSKQRLILHLAAVVVNNFTNHFYSISKDLLDKNQISFEILKPLILETARKASVYNPIEIQTGPGKRGDQKVIGQHLQLLNGDSELQKLYQMVSDHILKTHSNEGK